MQGVEMFANEASTTLSASTTTTATSLTVASSTSFPAISSGPNFFMARLEPNTPDGTREFVKVTAVSGSTWTVVRAQEGSTGTAWASGAKVTAILTAGTLGRLLQTLNTDTYITDLLNQKFASVHINDDGTSSTTWPNRLEFFFTPSGGVENHTTYLNEYGEFRCAPAKGNTVPWRLFTREFPAGSAHTVNMMEIQDDRTNRNVLWAVDSAGNVTAANLPPAIVASSTAPSSPAVGTIWVDTSS